MLDAEVVEHADDGAAEILAAVAVVVGGDRVDQPVEPALGVAGVERGERVGELRVVLEPDAGGEAVGGERAGDVAEQLERLLVVAALVQEPGERDGGVGAAGLELERRAQRLLVAGLDEAVGLGGQQPVEELLDLRRRLGADELGDELAVLERLDGRDALDAGTRRRDARLASVSSLASATLPSRSVDEPSRARA